MWGCEGSLELSRAGKDAALASVPEELGESCWLPKLLGASLLSVAGTALAVLCWLEGALGFPGSLCPPKAWCSSLPQLPPSRRKAVPVCYPSKCYSMQAAMLDSLLFVFLTL